MENTNRLKISASLLITLSLLIFFLTSSFCFSNDLSTIKNTAPLNNLYKSNTSLYDVEGLYSVGKTTCRIKWNANERSYTVKWKKGTGYTYLFLVNDRIYDEYDSDGVTYSGRFVFTSADCSFGRYERADGKVFSVTKL